MSFSNRETGWMKTITEYEAFDGTRFPTAEECVAHERKTLPSAFVGLSVERVLAALRLEDIALSDAFEKIGQQIGAARRKSG